MAVKKKPAKKPEKKAGRPSPYKEEMNKLAYQFCLLGATNEKLAELLGVSLATIGLWIQTKPAFSDAIKAGREIADAEIAEATFHRAKGYSHKATKFQLHRDGTWKSIEYTEHFPPDTTAAKFWLMNRQPEKWREKLDIEQKVLTVTVEGEDNDANEND